MNEQHILLASLISLASIVIMGFWLYRDYRVDTLRQQLFCLRDSLFDDAAAALVDFEHPAYGMLRTTLNGFIRFAHRVNFFHAIAVVFIFRRLRNELPPMFNERFETSIESLGDRQKELFQRYRFAMNLIVARHLVLSSPLVFMLVLVESFHTANRLVDWLQRPVDQFESLALAEGEI